MANLTELVVPELGESITEAIVGRWLKKVGDVVEVDEPVVDLETDKITVQLPSPAAGALTEHLFAEGDTVKVGDIVGHIDVDAEVSRGDGAAAKPAEPSRAQAEAKPAEKPAPASGNGEARPPAAVRAAVAEAATPRDAMERVNELRRLTPSQRRAVRQGKPVPSAQIAEAAPVAAEPRENVVPMTPLRKRIAQRLVQAQQATASLTTFNEVDMTNCMALRSRFKDQFLETHGVKLGFMSFFVKAAVAALELWPGLNAEIREDSIVYKSYYDIGIAVGTDRGLVVPVLRGADQLGFAEIESGINELAAKARDSKLKLDDLVGATFTISNGGVYGSMMSTPLLNYPQTGILGMHNIVKRPVAVGNEVQVRPVMYIALTYDHRVVDGFEAVSFLRAIKDRVESPDRLLFEV